MENLMTQSLLAAQFRERHSQTTPIVLPNVWDACSAALMQSLGAEAIATTSAGVAWSCGYRDGDQLPIDVHVSAVRQIGRVVSSPLTVDAEGGYSDNPRQVGENVARLVDAGAIGVNLEDGRSEPDLLCRKIEAVKVAALRNGVDLFVNARTDVYLQELAPGKELAEILRRASLYAAGGADCLFVPKVIAASDIRVLIEQQSLPLNVMACPGLPNLAELTTLGVRRLSAGSSIAQKAWAVAKLSALRFLATGGAETLFTDTSSFDNVNATLPDCG
jgi:2-methylisocitrate lyase-like PEP mutase family enzyme